MGRRQLCCLGVVGKFFWLGIRRLPYQAIKTAKLGSRVVGIRRVVTAVLPAPEDHPELRSPITEVVVGCHLMPTKRQDAGKGVTDHRGTDVAHVHRLGHIRR